jgi:hypothetical protein
MLLDYIYLIIIIALLLVVVFLIYLSYEYRVFEVNEPFSLGDALTDAVFDTPNENIAENMKILLQNYNETIDNSNNQQEKQTGIQLLSLLNDSQSNYNNSNTLLQSSYGLQPISKTFPVDQVIKTIKSNYNSQYLSLVANDPTKYGILVNDKCLTISGTCPDDGICTQKCEKGLFVTDSQKFYPSRIYSANDAAKIMKTTSDKISTKNVYPFNVFRSNVNDKCLSVNDDGLTLADCNLNLLSQQWTISPNENICILA